nr:hypothetical protein [uncultured Cohaesibacter sp.]
MQQPTSHNRYCTSQSQSQSQSQFLEGRSCPALGDPHAVPDPLPHPLSSGRGQAVSLLRKAISRGHVDLVGRAAAALWHQSPDLLRCQIALAAFADIGVGDLPALAFVASALTDRGICRTFEEDWSILGPVLDCLCSTSKSQSASDLLALLKHWSELEGERQRVSSLPTDGLDRLMVSDLDLMVRGFILLECLKRGHQSFAFDLLSDIGVAPTMRTIAKEGFRQTGSIFPLLVALLTLQNGLREETRPDPLMGTRWIGKVPCWTLDGSTAIGRQALRQLAQSNTGLGYWLREAVPPHKQLSCLVHLLRHVEGNLCLCRMDGPLATNLKRKAQREALRLNLTSISSDRIAQALPLMRQAIPILNEMREEAMEQGASNQ